jgi:hypothetical protein
VAEVKARRLDSPMDSMLKICDAKGKVLAFNDDYGDPATGLNTHHADSYLRFKLPADGAYYVHLTEAARSGGDAYAYRLRVSAPQPDFALRLEPSSRAVKSKGWVTTTVYAIRKDGYRGPIELTWKDLPEGFTPRKKITLPANQEKAKLSVQTTLKENDQPFSLFVEGRAKIGGKDITHQAVPSDDRMQAFLWRHLVPAKELKVLVYNQSRKLHTIRKAPPMPEKSDAPKEIVKAGGGKKLKFSKKQITGRLRQLKRLYEACLLTDDFYNEKVEECLVSM